MNSRFYLIFTLLIVSSGISFGAPKPKPIAPPSTWSQSSTEDLQKQRVLLTRKSRSWQTLSESQRRQLAFHRRKTEKELRSRGIATPKPKKKSPPKKRRFRKYDPFKGSPFLSVETCLLPPSPCEYKPFDPFNYAFPQEEIESSEELVQQENVDNVTIPTTMREISKKPFSLFCYSPSKPHSFFTRDYFDNGTE